MDREQKKKELLVKLNRNTIIKELEQYLSVDLNCFLSIDETNCLQKKIYKKLDCLDSAKELNKNPTNNINAIIALESQFETVQQNYAVLFYSKSHVYGALKIKMQDLFLNIHKLTTFTKFFSDYYDFIVVEKELKFGLCIERFEYINKLTYWI